jgi:hypothetical protein
VVVEQRNEILEPRIVRINRIPRRPRIERAEQNLIRFILSIRGSFFRHFWILQTDGRSI